MRSLCRWSTCTWSCLSSVLSTQQCLCIPPGHGDLPARAPGDMARVPGLDLLPPHTQSYTRPALEISACKHAIQRNYFSICAVSRCTLTSYQHSLMQVLQVCPQKKGSRAPPCQGAAGGDVGQSKSSHHTTGSRAVHAWAFEQN